MGVAASSCTIDARFVVSIGEKIFPGANVIKPFAAVTYAFS
jgi:hypothetical protein